MTWTVVVAMGLVIAACSDDGGGSEKGASSTLPADGEGEGASALIGGAAQSAPVAPTLMLSDADALAAASTYADVVHASYADSVAAAEALRTSIGALVGTPSEATLAAARQQWVTARNAYTRTEAFRFYDGPIDHPEHGPQRRIDGWPVDGAQIEALVGDVEGTPVIDVGSLVAASASANTSDGASGGANTGDGDGDGASANRTGWHALEFLLWGEDTSDDGSGSRPASDLETGPGAERRRAYLNASVELLVIDLASVRDQWAPGTGAYRTAFLAEPVRSVERMLQGMGALSADELAGRRLQAALESGDPVHELSRFSDNTLNDLVGNIAGIRAAYTGDREGVEGVSLGDVVARLAPDVDADLRKQFDNNLAAAEALPGPFDQVIAAGDDDLDRAELVDLAGDLLAQGEAISALASSLGLAISLGQ